MKKATERKLITLAIMSLFLIGCKSQVNETQTEIENYAIITIQNDSDTEIISSRSASTVKPKKIDYTVTAYKTDEKGNVLTSEQNGMAVTELEPFEGIALTYKLPLPTGSWIFDVKGYEHTGSDTELMGEEQRTNVILYG